jgi:hypothetical protein
MTRLVLVAAALATLAAANPAQAKVVPGKGMAGVRIGMLEDAVVAKLGKPDSRRTVSDDFGPHLRLRYASHGGLRLVLRENEDGDMELFQIRTAGTKERTKEGVGVGSSERQLKRRLEGERCETISGHRSCTLGSFLIGRVVTDFVIRSKHVVSVTVGRVVD